MIDAAGAIQDQLMNDEAEGALSQDGGPDINQDAIVQIDIVRDTRAANKALQQIFIGTRTQITSETFLQNAKVFF